MKKTVAYTALLLAAVGLIGPKLVGAGSKSQIDEYMRLINEQSVYEVSWKAYESGWFNSSGTVHVKLKLPPFVSLAQTDDRVAGEQLIAVDFDLSLQHGPVLTGKPGLGLASWQLVLVQPKGLEGALQWEQSQPLYSASGHTGLFGGMDFSELIPALTVDGETNVTFSGYASNGAFKNGRFSYRGSSKGISIIEAEEEVRIGELNVEGEFEADFATMISGALYNMEGSLTLAAIEGGDEFSMENLVLTVNSDISDDGKVANMRAGYAIDRLNAEDILSPDAGVDLAIDNYSSEFNQRYTRMVTSSLSAGEPEQIQAQIQAMMLEALPFLLAENPELRLENLRFTLPEGTFKGSGQLKLEGVTALPANPTDPAFWLQHTILSASLAADNALAELMAVQMAQTQMAADAPPETPPEQLAEAARQQGPMMLGMLGQQGMLVQKEGQYRFDFSYDKGQTVLNGNPIELPLEALLGGQ